MVVFSSEWMVFIEGWKFSPSRLLFHFDVYTKGTFFSYLACGTLFHLWANSKWVNWHRIFPGPDEWCKLLGYLFYSFVISLISSGHVFSDSCSASGWSESFYGVLLHFVSPAAVPVTLQLLNLSGCYLFIPVITN